MCYVLAMKIYKKVLKAAFFLTVSTILIGCSQNAKSESSRNDVGFEPTCPSTFENCSAYNQLSACHRSCGTYCQSLNWDQPKFVDCMSCKAGSSLSSLFDDTSGVCINVRDQGIGRTVASCTNKRNSGQSDVMVNAVVVNNFKDPIEVYWIDFDGDLVSYGVLGSGDALGLKTFEGHPWIFVDPIEENCVGNWDPVKSKDQDDFIATCADCFL